MLGRQHIAFGLASSAAVSLAVYNPQSPIFAYPAIVVGFSALGSLLPDIDHPDSYAGQLFLPVARLIDYLFGHRTVTHDVVIMLPLFLISIFSKNPIFFGIMFGVMGHLFLDALTKDGVCFNYFGNRKAYKTGMDRYAIGRLFLLPWKLRVRSNSFMAKVVTYALCIAIVVGTEFILQKFGGTSMANAIFN